MIMFEHHHIETHFTVLQYYMNFFSKLCRQVILIFKFDFSTVKNVFTIGKMALQITAYYRDIPNSTGFSAVTTDCDDRA